MSRLTMERNRLESIVNEFESKHYNLVEELKNKEDLLKEKTVTRNRAKSVADQNRVLSSEVIQLKRNTQT